MKYVATDTDFEDDDLEVDELADEEFRELCCRLNCRDDEAAAKGVYVGSDRHAVDFTRSA